MVKLLKCLNKMNKEEVIKEVITILDRSNYIDPAEHLYDGLKQIKREITYATVHDFLWTLESKQCAIKAVNEILNAFSNTFDDYVVEPSKVGGYKNMKKYWEEVKQELDKL